MQIFTTLKNANKLLLKLTRTVKIMVNKLLLNLTGQ